MKDSPCRAILLRLKLSSPHRTLVLIKQLLCTEAPSFTSCRSSLFFFVLDKFFFVLVSSLSLHITAFKFVLPLLRTFCHKRFFTPKMLKIFVRLASWEVFFFWLILCCYISLCSKFSSFHCSSSRLFCVLEKFFPFFNRFSVVTHYSLF